MNPESQIRTEFLKTFVQNLILGVKYSKNITSEEVKPAIEKKNDGIANLLMINQSQNIKQLINENIGAKNISENQKQFESIFKPMQKKEPLLPSQMRKEIKMDNPIKVKPIQPMPINKKLNFSPRRPLPIPRPAQFPKGTGVLNSYAKPNVFLQGNEQEIKLPMIPSVKHETTLLGLPELDKILQDPDVQTIECPGPNKQVLVYKNGSIQPISLSLTNDEISNAMKEISEKTRIPLMSGIFKAAMGDLVITAVMSEFVGTRFMVQKKPPQVQG